jgi:hypothetical protein
MSISNWITVARDRIARYKSDQNGAVTVEFVVLVPILFIWGVGSFLYYDAYRSLAITNKVGFTVTDIASRYEAITNEDILELQSLAERMLPPRDRDYRLRISSICYDETPTDGGDPVYRIRWSGVANEGQKVDENGDPILDPYGIPVPILSRREGEEDIPTDIIPIMADQDTVLYVELYSTWRPLSTKLMPINEKTWFVDLFVRPRFVRSIPKVTYDSDGDIETTTQKDCEPEGAPAS